MRKASNQQDTRQTQLSRVKSSLALAILAHAILDPLACQRRLFVGLFEVHFEEVVAAHFLDPIRVTVGDLHSLAHGGSVPVSVDVVLDALGDIFILETVFVGGTKGDGQVSAGKGRRIDMAVRSNSPSPFIVLQPRVRVDIGNRVLVSNEPVMVFESRVEHLVETFSFRNVARLAVRDVFRCVADKVVRLTCRHKRDGQ